jgi:hypothetical protein
MRNRNSLLSFFIVWGILAVVAMFAVVVIMAATVDAHEDGVFKHLEKGQTIGPNVIAIVQCGTNSWVLLVDTSEPRDWVHDECYYVFNEHDQTHYKPINVCQCEEDDYNGSKRR